MTKLAPPADPASTQAASAMGMAYGTTARMPASSDTVVCSVDQSTPYADIWLAEAFARLNLQAKLLGQTGPRLTIKERHNNLAAIALAIPILHRSKRESGRHLEPDPRPRGD